jgi:hypothetical protein
MSADDLIRLHDEMTVEERADWMLRDPGTYWPAAEASARAMVERDAARARSRAARRRCERLTRPFRWLATAAQRLFGGDQR